MRSVWAGFQCKVRQNPIKMRNGGPRPAKERHTDGHCPSARSLICPETLEGEATYPWVLVTDNTTEGTKY